MAIDRIAILTDGYRNEEIYPTPAQIADAVWNELTSGHTVAGSYGNEVPKISKKLDRNLVWLLP
jgi:hypothetical protein